MESEGQIKGKSKLDCQKEDVVLQQRSIVSFNGLLEVTCPECNKPTRIPLENSSIPIKCECGLIYYLSEIQMKDLRKNLEEIRWARNDMSNPAFN